MIEGPVLWRDQPGYEEARLGAIWNPVKPDRKPSAIVHALHAQDVSGSIQLARERGLHVKARSGGHSWTASGIRDNSVLVDVSRLNDISVDASGMTATVGPGVLGQELNRALERHGLFFPTGHCPTVGVAGFLLTGGYGWHSQHLGPACMSMVGIDVVLADGRLVHADEATNSDLLWAARGAGAGFFGVITQFHLRCYPRPRTMMSSVYLYPLSVLDEVLAWARVLGPDLSSEVELVMIGTTPQGPGLPPDGPPMLMVVATAMSDTEDAAEQGLRPLESCPVFEQSTVLQAYKPVSMNELEAIGDAAHPSEFRWAVDNMWTDASAEELVPAVRGLFLDMPTPISHVFWQNWPYPPVLDAALSTTGKIYIAAYSAWTDPDEDEKHRFWGRDAMRALAHLSTGIQLGDENLDGRPEARFLSDENLDRLADLRAEWDPTGLFLGYLAGNE